MTADRTLSKLNYAGVFLILTANMIVACVLECIAPMQWLLASKDIILVALLCGNLFVLRTIPLRLTKVLTVLLIYLVVHLFSLGEVDLSVMASIRQMLIPFLIIILGWFIGQRNEMEEVRPRFKEVTIYILMGSVLFYILAASGMLPIEVYSGLKSMQLDYLGLPLMFEDSLTGGHIRNVSFFLDPINLGHALVFLLVYGWYKKTLSRVMLVLVLIAMLLTVCKGAYVQLAMIIFVLEFKWIPNWLRYSVIIIGMAGLLYIFQWHDGIRAHTEGLLTALEHMSLFGEGIAKVGNQAVMYGDQSVLPIYDTFIGSILGQIGIVGLIAWLVPFFMITDFKKMPILSTILFTQLIIAAVSENAFNFLSVFLLLLMIGIQLSQGKSALHAE